MVLDCESGSSKEKKAVCMSHYTIPLSQIHKHSSQMFESFPEHQIIFAQCYDIIILKGYCTVF